MKGKVNRNILEELAKFKDWWSSKKNGEYAVRISTNQVILGTFSDYLHHEYGIVSSGSFMSEDYQNILKVYEDYYDTDGSVLKDYQQVREILSIFGNDFEIWLSNREE